MATARRVVLIPGQSISHLTPMMEFAAVCLRRGLAVTVAVPDPTLTSPAFRSTIGRYASRLPSLSVHSLPLPPAHHHSVDAAHPFIRMQAAFRSQAPGLRDLLRSLPAVHALVADMFAACLLDVAAEVGVPGHLFYCTGAANLSVFLELPSFCSGSGGNVKDLGDAPVSFPGVPTMPASHLVDAVLDSGTDLYAAVLDVFGRMAAARGILMDVLRHASTGTFITHCGWNSTLEAAATGVPMVCWPLEAEQWMNKVYIVEEMKVGVAVKGYNKPGVLVTAENVDATVRQIMDMESEGRRAVVERAMAVKESAAAAWKEGGSSCAAFAEFVKQME
ncbi:unnamed protein product [Triticum turgidum subsp. durum]|uniref:Glycosyltransferase n=1 Tax=Triticum turgidum subsp. durum TaxID=4567 RepID=A0A9R1A6U8_TRITD|nr:unnamed protein product [Triticum turgidum subsp. durum]